MAKQQVNIQSPDSEEELINRLEQILDGVGDEFQSIRTAVDAVGKRLMETRLLLQQRKITLLREG